MTLMRIKLAAFLRYLADKLSPPPVYTHFKGGRYEYLYDGFLEADMTNVVIYRSVKKRDRVFVRPKASFDQILPWPDNIERPRFARGPNVK